MQEGDQAPQNQSSLVLLSMQQTLLASRNVGWCGVFSSINNNSKRKREHVSPYGKPGKDRNLVANVPHKGFYLL